MGKFKRKSPRKERSKSESKNNKPTFPTKELIRLIEYLQTSEETSKTEGVFRISGNSIEIKSLVKQLTKKRDTRFQDYTVHGLCGALKLWFRNLPDPIMKSELYPAWLKAVDIPEKPAQLSAFKRLLNMLGPESRNILEKLIKLLVKVELNRQSTLMNSKNLAIVFSPTLLRAPATVVDVIQLLGEQVKGSVVIEALIQEYKFFFVSTATNYADLPVLNRQVSVPEQEFYSCFAECSVSMTKAILQRQKARAEPEPDSQEQEKPITTSDLTGSSKFVLPPKPQEPSKRVHRHTLDMNAQNPIKPPPPNKPMSKSSKLPRLLQPINSTEQPGEQSKRASFVTAVPQLGSLESLAPAPSSGGTLRSPRSLLASARSKSPRSLLYSSDGANVSPEASPRKQETSAPPPPPRPSKGAIHERRKQLRKKITAKKFAEGDLILARTIAANLKLTSRSSLESLLSPEQNDNAPTEDPQNPPTEELQTKQETPLEFDNKKLCESSDHLECSSDTELSADDLAEDLVLGILSGNVEEVVACVDLLDAEQCTKLLQSVLGEDGPTGERPNTLRDFDLDLDFDVELSENDDDDEPWELSIDEPELDPSLFSDHFDPLSQEEILEKVELEKQLSGSL